MTIDMPENKLLIRLLTLCQLNLNLSALHSVMHVFLAARYIAGYFHSSETTVAINTVYSVHEQNNHVFA